MKKKFTPHIIVVVALLVLIFISLASASKETARETLPRTAVTLQRVRESTTLLDELLGTETSIDTPMQIYINDEPHELANGETKTITVINGEFIVYAVLGNVESKSVRFTAESQTISVNVSIKRGFLGQISLEIEVK